MSAAVLVAWAIVRVIRNNLRWFDVGHDFLAYHLPFGIKIFEPDAIHITPHLEELFRGNPLLLHFLIGAMWKLHPTVPINFTHMLGVAMWLLAGGFASLVLGRHAVVWVMLTLGTPLILIHTMVGGIDLPANAFVFIALVCIHRLTIGDCRRAVWVACGLLALGAAGAAKYTVFPVAVATGAIFAGTLYARLDVKGWKKSVVVALALIMPSLWAIRNTIELGNPIYPLRPPMIGDLVPHNWNPLGGGTQGQWPADLVGVPQPIVTIASLVEFSVPEPSAGKPRYEAGQYGNGPGTRGFRMGGFWWPILAAQCAFLAFCLRKRLVHGRELVPLLLLVGFVLFLPQSHEMRYFLFIPMTLSFLCVSGLKRIAEVRVRGAVLAIAIVFAGSSMWINREYLVKHTRSLQEFALTQGLDWGGMTQGALYCGRNMGRNLVLLLGPTLRENRVRWSGDGVPCPFGSIEITGRYPWW